MAKSMRSKREKRLRAIRREIVEKETFHHKKEEAKVAAFDAALAAPNVAVRPAPASPLMDTTPSSTAAVDDIGFADVDMVGGKQSNSLKAIGGVGKKLKKKLKMGKTKRRSKGLLRGKRV